MPAIACRVTLLLLLSVPLATGARELAPSNPAAASDGEIGTARARALFYEGDADAAILLFEAELGPGSDLTDLVRYVEAGRAAGELDRVQAYLAGIVDSDFSRAHPQAALGLATRWRGDCEAAQRHYWQALSLAATDPRLYYAHHEAARECGDRDAARERLRSLGDAVPAAWSWCAAARGQLSLGLGDVDGAAALADTVLTQRSDHPLGLVLLASVQAARHDHEAALANWPRAREASEQVDAVNLAVWCRAGTASALASLGRYEEAVATLEAVVQDRATDRDRLGEARNRQRLSRALAKQGRYPEALAVTENALELAAGMGDRRLDMLLAEELGLVRFHLGDFRAAAEHMGRSQRFAAELGATDHWLKVSTNLATAYAVLGDYDRADSTYLLLLTRYQERQEAYGQLFCVSGLGFNCIDRGDYLGGLGYLHRALDLAEQVGEQGEIQRHRHVLGIVYRALGELDMAEDQISQALAMAREMEHPGMIAANYAVLGQIDLQRGDIDAGLERLRVAAGLYGQIDDTPGLASVYLDLGQAHLVAARPDSAVHFSRLATSLNRASGSGLGEGFGLLYTARALLEAGDPEAAAAAADSVLDLGRKLAANQLVWQAEEMLGATAARQDDWSRARQHYAQALAYLELSQRNLLEDEHRISFGAGKQVLYEEAIAVELRAAGSDSAAAATFALAERGRARALRDGLAASGLSRRAIIDAPPELQAEEQRLRDRITRIQRELWQDDLTAADRDERGHELLALKSEHDLVLAECHGRRGAHAGVTWPRPLETAEIQQVVLTDGDLLLEFFLGEENSWCWMVTRHTIRLVELPPRAEMTALVDETQAWLSRPPSSRADPPPAHAALSRILLGPFEATLSKAKRVIVVADGALGRLPFEALTADDNGERHYLAEVAPVVYLPSAATAPLLARSVETDRTGLQVLAFAFAGNAASVPTVPVVAAATNRDRTLGPLPFAQEEVTGIAEQMPGTVELITGADAHEARFKAADLSAMSIVHLATHALVDANHPERSGVFLGADPAGAEDGFLWMREIRELPLQTDLVVLSACESGVGEAVPGEGVIALARAFLYAGSSGVLASLWPVNDRATCLWMREFYARLAAGESAGAAARTARLSLLRGDSPALRHPYYWAPFVLIGKDR